MSTLKAVVVGLGSIGRRHLGNLRLVAPNTYITVWRHSPDSRASSDGLSQADRVVYGLEEALDPMPDVALITCPASFHVERALALARHGVHLFIEKPLSHTLDGVDDLLETSRRLSAVLMVGYNFHFYRPFQVIERAMAEGRIGRVIGLRAEVGQYLPYWRPNRDYRQTVSARSDLGGGVVLELSHELEYARRLVGEVKTVSAHTAHVSDLEIDVEDTAEIILQFRNGAIGSVHLDMVQRPATRSCRIVGTAGMLTWDWESHRVRLFSQATEAWSDLHPPQEVDRNEMYLDELRHFLECVREGGIPAITGEDGRCLVEIAQAVKQSSREQRVVAL